ncbi:methanol/ethanol family PQQ-dependent dehydrogenase [Aromatoleum petrolei]|uniref:PQQ-dependent dehydrogenase, methanol/ethanol family n=1 Tax=Aromatoleum petrolei TaxID=76116 RepID=A0ABX1MMC0_9RHOO|nr:methanol/ethanol family PQQ-dependent dehydrogenase [Aromatoleum petrolei]NMF87778.1 PQQ-dependent dehydrogenase, methanol/ethanol family [Aromatoleum petrolei]QTQ38269.1 PQQ-dependent dehydrogenase, methanol/ethanol family [Aromatoleum petrolei]
MKNKIRPLVAALALTPLLATAALPQYAPVTDIRLANPEPQNWLSYRGNYASWGYSSLKQINTQNVAKLKLAWAYSTGMTEGHQSPPIVNNGYMYITTPNNQVIAFEAATGKELWRYKKTIPEELQQLHPTNRGVALYGNKLYLATTDATLVALDAVTGKELWKTAVADWKKGYYMTLAPLAAKGKIMVGSSGGEYGIRGFVAAFDAETGKEAWRTHTVAGPGEPGGDTWPADTYKRGGGSVWITGSYDPDTNLAYWGVGNAGPWMPDTRAGDNLYANSTIALDVDTGKLKGYHQYHWNDGWDWDEVSAPLLIDVERNGKKIKSLVHAGRNGYLWLLERTNSKINFVDAWPYVTQNVFKSIDPKTGRPTYDPARTPGTGKTVNFCPSLWGGKDWPPEAYNPGTGLLYIPANNNLCSELTGEPAKYNAGELYIGVSIDNILTNVRMDDKARKHVGEVQAWDIKTGKKVWTHTYPEMNWGPLLTTGGNLVFGGGTNDRKFRAFDATNGKLLWEFPTNSGVTGVPSTFEIDGEQFVAVQSGWGVDAQRMQGAFDAVLPHKTVVPQGGVLMVFKLEQ